MSLPRFVAAPECHFDKLSFIQLWLKLTLVCRFRVNNSASLWSWQQPDTEPGDRLSPFPCGDSRHYGDHDNRVRGHQVAHNGWTVLVTLLVTLLDALCWMNSAR
ncbi:hypothetical protein ACOMHN_042558 [Nucella lapillus]